MPASSPSSSTSSTASSASGSASASRSRDDRVLRVRVTGFPRRALAAFCDLALLLGMTAAVTMTVGLILHVPMPGWREVGPDLLVAGILDRNPMAVGAVGLFLGMTGLYQLYFAG